MIRVNFYCCLDKQFNKTDKFELRSIVEVKDHADIDKVVIDKFTQHSAEGWKVTIDAPDNLRRVSELIREIIGLGVQWVPVLPKARTAVNCFIDPISNRRYTTCTTGKIYGEQIPTNGKKTWQSTVNLIRREYYKYPNGVVSSHKICTIVKLYSEEARLERLLECLKIVKAKQVAKYLRKIEAQKKSRPKVSGSRFFYYL